MKHLLLNLEQLNKHLSFVKKAFTKGGFRHVVQYIDGVITLNKKTARQISKASPTEKHHSALSRVLTEAKFKQYELEKRYLKKVAYLTKGQQVSLLFDDTLVKREGKKVEETQRHKNDLDGEEFIIGHQFFTAVIYTPAIQLPLFPKLYSKNTTSKIDMASDLVDFVLEHMQLNEIIFDSWYSDKKLINKCLTKKVKVVCGIKANRNVSFEKGEWQNLSAFSKTLKLDELENYWIDEVKYKIGEYKAKLKGIPVVKLIASHKYNEKEKEWNGTRYFISTCVEDTSVQIVRTYRIRWFIETYHRDMKQNLGFAKVFVRKREGIVRHAILSSLAYAVLRLFMFARGMVMTIGECIAYIQGKAMEGFIRELIEVEDKRQRIQIFEEVFISKTAKV